MSFEIAPSNSTAPGQQSAPVETITRKTKIISDNASAFQEVTGAPVEPIDPLTQQPKEAKPKEEPASKRPAITDQDRRVYKKSVELRQREKQIAQIEPILQTAKSLGMTPEQVVAVLEAVPLLKTNPVEALKRAGMPWEEVAKFVIEHPEAAAQGPVNAEVQQARREIAEVKAQLAQRDLAAKQAEERLQISQAKSTIQSRIMEEKSKYPYLNAAGREAVEKLWESVWDDYQVSGKAPDIDTYFAGAEDAYRDFHKKLSAAENRPARPPAQQRVTTMRPERPVRTLSNALSQRQPSTRNQPMSEEDEMRKIVSMLKG